MGKITFILGGARSGKSSLALNIAKGRVAFVATCQPLDKEMKERIGLHKKSRPSHWKTFENPDDMPKLLRGAGKSFDFIIIDCLTLFVSGLLLKGKSQACIEKKIRDILKILRKIRAKSLVISNEVGLGIVPGNKLSRDFRDIAGRVNQITAQNSDEVIFMLSGIPVKMKG